MTTEQELNLEELIANIGTEVTTAFLVIQSVDGSWSAVPQFKELNLDMAREAVFDDIVGGVSAVHAGCISQQSAMHTVMIMQQQGAQMREQMRQQQEANKVAQLLDPKLLRA
jgi:hypothetical protein